MGRYRFLLLACMTGIFLVGCTGLFFEKPVITLKEIHVRQISLVDADLIVVAEIQNPNTYELRLKSFRYAVQLNDQEIGNGTLQKELTVPPAASTILDIPLTAHFGNPAGIARWMRPDKELSYRLDGKALVQAGLFERNFDVNRTGAITLIPPSGKSF